MLGDKKVYAHNKIQFYFLLTKKDNTIMLQNNLFCFSSGSLAFLQINQQP